MNANTFHNNLRLYTIDFNESPEAAEAMEKDFLNRFNALSKWDQVNISLIAQTQGFEWAFVELDKLS